MSWPAAPPTRSGQDAWDDPGLVAKDMMKFQVTVDLEKLEGLFNGVGHDERDFGMDYIPPGVTP
jgi:hypothetical protein